MGRFDHRFFSPAYDAAEWLEPKLRKAVGLEPKAPHAVPMLFGPPDERGLVEMLDISPEDRVAEYRAWHQEPRRAKAISRGMEAIKDLGRGLDRLEDLSQVKSRVRSRQVLRKLKGARTLTWEPYHYWPYGEPAQIDGRLVFSKNPDDRLPLDISCLGMEEFWIKEAARDGEVYVKEPEVQRVEAIVMPTKVLSPELVELGLKIWYMNRFEFEQGHWAVVEKRLPNFEIIKAEETTDDSELQEKRRKAVIKAHKEMNALLKQAAKNPYSTPNWSEYGQSLEDLLLPTS